MNTDAHDGQTAARPTNDGGGRRRSLWKSPALVAALMVTILLLASHFVDGWHWPPGAFVVVGALIFGIGFTYELVTRNPEVTMWTPPELRGFAGNAVNAMLFVGSALLFRKAAREEPVTGAV